MATTQRESAIPNGAALAAALAAGIGAFAMGFIVILGEAGLPVGPALYAPAGGVSGRTTLAVVVWLIAWAVLHSRWRNRRITTRWVPRLALILTVLGVFLTLPPVWKLL